MPDELNGAAPAVTESTSAPSPDSGSTTSTPSETSSEPEARSFHEIAEAVWDKHNPPREAGKFVSRDAPQEQAAPGTENIDQPKEEVQEPAEPAIDVPHSWSSEMRAKFASLPPDVRQYVTERDREVTRQISSMGAQIKATEPVRSILEQHQDYLQRIGRTPEDAVKQLFNASRSLDQNPAATIKWLADAYRVDLRQLAQNQQQAPAPVTTDPRLEARLRRMEAEAAQRTQAEQIAREQNVSSTIEKYASDKSHPHFNDLEDEIIRQLPGIRQSDPYLSPEQMLDQAYEKAKWAHPTVRQRILMDQQKADEAKRKSEQDKQIKEARRQVGINQSSNGRGSTPVKGSIRDSLMRHADRLMGS